MKIIFKKLDYQIQAVDSVVSCFKGQPKQDIIYNVASRISDLGLDNQIYANCPLFDKSKILKNIQQVQKSNELQISKSLDTNDYKGNRLTNSPVNLSIEMETGTGKTYVFLRTIFELNKQYGWSRFIIVVPSIAIREGIYKSLQMTSDHFMQEYQEKAKYFIYNSANLPDIEHFSSNSGINIMIINIQAFNSKGENNRRIYEELDIFQSRKPIDIIKQSNPILILDEPQKMSAEKTLESLANFNPLFILRFSATHKHQYNLIYRLDAIGSFNQKLVKKIEVTGIEVESGLSGVDGYLYLQNIILSKSAPEAKLEIEINNKDGFKRELRKVKKGDNLYTLSKNANQYKDRFIVTEINDTAIEFLNGKSIEVGQVLGKVDEKTINTIQIREAIRSHIAKEKCVYPLGIKVLSLFFIDEVAKYRQYDDKNNIIDGEYVKIFEEQYKNIIKEQEYTKYQEYLNNIKIDETHKGYFAIDKNKRLINPAFNKRSGESDDISAYDLILKDKERLLSFDEPTRFIFSHSALKEGWDNPNVFVICALKKSDNTISRRQEIGRGLRLAVNKDGVRIDADYFDGNKQEIHKINTLSVIVNESYSKFAQQLQTEILETISRPKKVTLEFLKKNINKITDRQVNTIYNYLVDNNYIDENDQVTTTYEQDRQKGNLEELDNSLSEYKEQIFEAIDLCISSNSFNKMIGNARKNQVNEINHLNLEKKEFKELWEKINKQTTFEVDIDTDKLIKKCIAKINNNFCRFEPLTYKIIHGVQKDSIDENQSMFDEKDITRERKVLDRYSPIKFDLLGSCATKTELTRKTIALILSGIKSEIFEQYKLNPEIFIREITKLINEQKQEFLLKNLKYHILKNKEYELDKIFVSNPYNIDDKNYFEANKSIYKRIIFDSDIEENFAKDLEKATDVVVYTKLPRTFKIPTPFGSYTPDWAIAFDKNKIKYIYFIVETKGDDNIDNLSKSEQNKIKSAKNYFKSLENKDINIKYKVVKSYKKLSDELSYF